MTVWPTEADIDRLNERIGQLVGEGFPFSEAMGQARAESSAWQNHDILADDRVKLTLLRAPDDVSHQDPSFQEEIKEFAAALKDVGAEPEARWLTQDAIDAWCGYVGVIVIAGSAIKAAQPAIVAYLKRRSGRSVQAEVGGVKIKIAEPTTEEADRVLSIVEDQIRAKSRKK
jgi:predicted ThiF/HesA family dinucleotide-utilizing enzyme